MTVIATAGHVDHGKSTFVNFLTKQETDRLPEEKKRGLTINLGYTYFTYENKTYSIVDVPGHKDYFKNTVSGFSNADVILFIIDSTENWSEQSEEHFQALVALKKRNFLFIYTKTDLLKDEIDKKILLTKIKSFQDINYEILEFNKVESKRKDFSKVIHEFIESCNFVTKNPSMWVDRAFTIDGTGKVITGTASTSFDYKNIIFNLYNQKLQIKEIQNRDAVNQENNETKRIAISLKKTNDSFPKRGDLLTNKEIVFTNMLFIKLNSDYNDYLFSKGTSRIFFGTDYANIKKINFIKIEQNTYVNLTISKAVPLPEFENVIIQNIDRNQIVGGEFLFFLSDTQNQKINKEINNSKGVKNLLDIFNTLNVKYFKENDKFARINDEYINESILIEVYELLENDISGINKAGVEKYFNDKYQIKVEIINEILKNYEDIEISNNQLIKINNDQDILISEYKKIYELLGDGLDVNSINVKSFDRKYLKELFLIKKIYRVNPKLVISDIHLEKLISIVKKLPENFSVTDFKKESNLSRKYSIPYLELLDKLKITTKIDKSGLRKMT
ncbi:SelB C-terminal domain-containing protein [Acidimicrobiaceae bacterium]|nr:SelB C-terminal domain-containing protein [Acidimicrobiaceae bacterium]